jgi:alpha-beta hydrolase superfamily lysophospholipase
MNMTHRDSSGPDTIVLIHGLWMTPRSWENWIEHYESKGFTVLAPAYPGLEVEVEALRADPSPIEALTIPATVEHLENIIRGLDKPPIIMGHSFGGVLTQILVDHGFGAAGVAINSVPAEGIRRNPPSQVKSLFPFVRNPIHHARASGFTPEQFHYAFTNTISLEESAKIYERYHIPTPNRFVWTGLLQNVLPGRQELYVNYKNGDRAPLLFIAGGADNIMPASVNKSSAEHHRRSGAVTDYKEFPGRSHYTIGEAGWEAVADYALDWAVEHSGPGSSSGNASRGKQRSTASSRS